MKSWFPSYRIHILPCMKLQFYDKLGLVPYHFGGITTGKHLFNDIFRDICDTYGIDQTTFQQIQGCDASCIRKFKSDTRPGAELLESLIACVSGRVSELDDHYRNKELRYRLNYEIFSNKYFTEEIRSQLLDMDDITSYLSYLMKKSNEFSSPIQMDGKFYHSGSELRNLTLKIGQAHQLYSNNLHQDALAIYKELLESPIIAELPYEEQITLYSDLGLIYRILGINQYDLSALNASLSYHHKACELSLKAEDFYQYALMNKYMGVVYTYLFNLQDAEDNLKKAIKCYDTALSVLPEQHEEYPKVLINYGILYLYYSDIRNSRNYLNNSITYFNRAAEYYVDDPTNYFHALIRLNCSGAYCLLAELCNPSVHTDLAEKMSLQALKVFTIEEHPIQYAQCISNLGISYSIKALYYDTVKNCEKAISFLNLSLTVFREEIDATSYSIAHQNLARTYILLSNYCNREENLGKASAHIDKCRKRYEALDHSVNNLKINLHDTEVLTDLADANENFVMLGTAETTILGLLEVSENAGYDFLSAELEYNLARVYSAYNRLTTDADYIKKGLISVNQSLHTFTLSEYPLKYARSAKLLAEFYAQIGNYNNYRTELDHALQVFTEAHYPEKHAQILKEMAQLIY